MPNLTSSQEDYLEAILEIGGGTGHVRTSEIAERLGVRRASVSATLHVLAARGLIEHRAYGRTSLTARGRARAIAIRRRHESLREFFADVLGLSPDSADTAACAMEHVAPCALPTRLRALMCWIRRQRGGWSWSRRTRTRTRRR